MSPNGMDAADSGYVVVIWSYYAGTTIVRQQVFDKEKAFTIQLATSTMAPTSFCTNGIHILNSTA